MGRTDTVRSCTSAALTFVKTMVNPAATVSNGMIVSKCALSARAPPLKTNIVHWSSSDITHRIVSLITPLATYQPASIKN